MKEYHAIIENWSARTDEIKNPYPCVRVRVFNLVKILVGKVGEPRDLPPTGLPLKARTWYPDAIPTGLGIPLRQTPRLIARFIWAAMFTRRGVLQLCRRVKCEAFREKTDQGAKNIKPIFTGFYPFLSIIQFV